MKFRMWRLVAASVLAMGVGMMGAQAVLEAVSHSPDEACDLVAVTASSAIAGNNAATPDDIEAIQSAIEGSRLSWWAAGRGTIGTDERNTQAAVYGVTGAFQDFHRMDMLYGSFIPRTAAGNMACVLDGDLAFRLFGTENAVGLEVKFMGKTFEVCGVCRADSSLPGLMSGDGSFRAYVSGAGLVAAGKMAIGGFEAVMPRGAPGESVQTLTAAMQSQGLSTGSFLIEDRSERALLSREKALIPLALLAGSATLVLLAFFLRVCRGVFRESLALLRGDYFRNVWGALLWRLAKALLLLAASLGACLLMWKGVGFDFYLPARYIPASWIDPSFYSGLIRSEAQAAVAAQAYPRQWWDAAVSSAESISGILNIIAFVGAIAAALSLRALWADRRCAAAISPGIKAQDAWDAPVLWLLALLSFCGAMILNAWMGLPPQYGIGALLAIALALGAWVVAMHREGLEILFFRKQAGETVHAPLQENGSS